MPFESLGAVSYSPSIVTMAVSVAVCEIASIGHNVEQSLIVRYLWDRDPAARIDNTWPVAALTARSEARHRLRIAISAYPTCIRGPIRGFPSEYCHAVWYGKT